MNTDFFLLIQRGKQSKNLIVVIYFCLFFVVFDILGILYLTRSLQPTTFSNAANTKLVCDIIMILPHFLLVQTTELIYT